MVISIIAILLTLKTSLATYAIHSSLRDLVLVATDKTIMTHKVNKQDYSNTQYTNIKCIRVHVHTYTSN